MRTMISEICSVRKELDGLINEAKEKKLWIFSYTDNTWFSPEQFEESIEEGKYVWAKRFFTLKEPKELINKYNKEIERLVEERKEIISRIKNSEHYT